MTWKLPFPTQYKPAGWRLWGGFIKWGCSLWKALISLSDWGDTETFFPNTIQARYVVHVGVVHRMGMISLILRRETSCPTGVTWKPSFSTQYNLLDGANGSVSSHGAALFASHKKECSHSLDLDLPFDVWEPPRRRCSRGSCT